MNNGDFPLPCLFSGGNNLVVHIIPKTKERERAVCLFLLFTAWFIVRGFTRFEQYVASQNGSVSV